MSYRMLALTSLVVNPANDRHGELENETAAIAHLFALREPHMRNLTKDLVVKGKMLSRLWSIPRAINSLLRMAIGGPRA